MWHNFRRRIFGKNFGGSLGPPHYVTGLAGDQSEWWGPADTLRAWSDAKSTQTHMRKHIMRNHRDRHTLHSYIIWGNTLWGIKERCLQLCIYKEAYLIWRITPIQMMYTHINFYKRTQKFICNVWWFHKLITTHLMIIWNICKHLLSKLCSL